ncbi:uncharacterized protein LOC144161597 [Haemaphysalis longicornis]
MEAKSPAGDPHQQPDLEHQTLPKPCGEIGAGEHPCASPVSRGAQWGLHAAGERGAWATTAGDDSPSEITPEYLTPAGSLFSLEFFCSTLEVFPSEQQQAVESAEESSRPTSSNQQRQGETACPDTASPSPSPVDEERPDTASPSPSPVVKELPDTASPTRSPAEVELPVDRIVDVPGERVDFRNTPSPLPLLSSGGYFPRQGYRNLADDGSSCDASSSDIRSSITGQHWAASYSTGAPLLCASPSSDGCASAHATPPSGEPSSMRSTVELEERLEEAPLETHIEQQSPRRRYRQLWASLWTGLRRLFQQLAPGHHQQKEREQVESFLRPGRHGIAQSNWEDEDDTASSDMFYTPGSRWSVRRLYQRFVSCLHAVSSRRGSQASRTTRRSFCSTRPLLGANKE